VHLNIVQISNEKNTDLFFEKEIVDDPDDEKSAPSKSLLEEINVKIYSSNL
jgi:hypothetical protein